MSTRVQVVMDRVEREVFRRQAALEGLSLSAWLREAAHERLRNGRAPMIGSVDQLRAFFSECDDRESGREPEWEEHLAAIEGSRAAGRPAT